MPTEVVEEVKSAVPVSTVAVTVLAGTAAGVVPTGLVEEMKSDDGAAAQVPSDKRRRVSVDGQYVAQHYRHDAAEVSTSDMSSSSEDESEGRSTPTYGERRVPARDIAVQAGPPALGIQRALVQGVTLQGMLRNREHVGLDPRSQLPVHMINGQPFLSSDVRPAEVGRPVRMIPGETPVARRKRQFGLEHEMGLSTLCARVLPDLHRRQYRRRRGIARMAPAMPTNVFDGGLLRRVGVVGTEPRLRGVFRAYGREPFEALDERLRHTRPTQRDFTDEHRSSRDSVPPVTRSSESFKARPVLPEQYVGAEVRPTVDPRRDTAHRHAMERCDENGNESPGMALDLQLLADRRTITPEEWQRLAEHHMPRQKRYYASRDNLEPRWLVWIDGYSREDLINAQRPHLTQPLRARQLFQQFWHQRRLVEVMNTTHFPFPVVSATRNTGSIANLALEAGARMGTRRSDHTVPWSRTVLQQIAQECAKLFLFLSETAVLVMLEGGESWYYTERALLRQLAEAEGSIRATLFKLMCFDDDPRDHSMPVPEETRIQSRVYWNTRLDKEQTTLNWLQSQYEGLMKMIASSITNTFKANLCSITIQVLQRGGLIRVAGNLVPPVIQQLVSQERVPSCNVIGGFKWIGAYPLLSTHLNTGRSGIFTLDWANESVLWARDERISAWFSGLLTPDILKQCRDEPQMRDHLGQPCPPLDLLRQGLWPNSETERRRMQQSSATLANAFSDANLRSTEQLIQSETKREEITSSRVPSQEEVRLMDTHRHGITAIYEWNRLAHLERSRRGLNTTHLPRMVQRELGESDNPADCQPECLMISISTCESKPGLPTIDWEKLCGSQRAREQLVAHVEVQEVKEPLNSRTQYTNVLDIDMIREYQVLADDAERTLWKKSHCSLVDGLWRRPSDSPNVVSAVCLPRAQVVDELKTILTRGVHHQLGHLGPAKTVIALKRFVWWQGMHRTVRTTLFRCSRCRRVQAHPVKYLEMRSLVATRPNQVVAIDHVGVFDEVSMPDGALHVLTIIDKFTRFMALAPVRSTTAAEAVEALQRYWLAYFGPPATILMDRGSAFTSDFFKKFCDTYEVKTIYCLAGHHEANGAVERANGTWQRMLRKVVTESNKNRWAALVPLVAMQYNLAVHSATGKSPMELMTSHLPILPLQHALGLGTSEAADADSPSVYCENMQRRMQELREVAQDQQRKALEAARVRYNRKVRLYTWKQGDIALLRVRDKGTKTSAALSGPWIVTRISTVDSVSLIHAVTRKALDNVYTGKLVLLITPVLDERDLLDDVEFPPNDRYYTYPFPLEEVLPTTSESATESVIEPVNTGKFNVESILGLRQRNGGAEFLVHWEGYPDSDDSWEPFSELTKVPALAKYLTANPRSAKRLASISKAQLDKRRKKRRRLGRQ